MDEGAQTLFLSTDGATATGLDIATILGRETTGRLASGEIAAGVGTSVRGACLAARAANAGQFAWAHDAYDSLPATAKAYFDWDARGRYVYCHYGDRLSMLNRPFNEVYRRELEGWVNPRRARRPGQDPAVLEELPEQPDVRQGLFGIALSGGGMRSGVFSLGVSQALSRYHILENADYLSTVSGGGYFGASLASLCAEELPYTGLPRLSTDSYDAFPFAFPRPRPGERSLVTATAEADRKAAEMPVHGVESPALWWVRRNARLLGTSLGLFDAATWITAGRYLASLAVLWALFLFPLPLLLILGGVAAFPHVADILKEWPDAARWALLFVPVLFPLAGLGAMSLIRPGTPLTERWRGAITVLAGLAVAWVGVPALAGAVALLVLITGDTTGDATAGGLAGAAASAGAIAEALGLRRLFTSEAGNPGRLTRLLVAAGGYLLLGAIVVLGAWAAWVLVQQEGPWVYAALGGPAAGLLLFSTVILRPEAGARLLNRLGIADIYEARLLRTWVIGARPAGTRDRDDVAPHDWDRVWPRGDLLVSELGEIARPASPYPIFCACLNVPGSRGEKLPDRKGDSFIISPLHFGSALTRWAEMCAAAGRTGSVDRAAVRWFQRMSIARAAGISGAAVSPNAGDKTERTVSIAATIFNARLGRWVPNPRRVHRAWWMNWPATIYAKELFGLASRDDRHVYLSDGGHFENQGLYELIRRRCKFILAVSADVEDTASEDSMGNLATAVRLVRVDFGAEIVMDALQPLWRDPKTGTVASYFAVGRIRYPGPRGGQSQDGESTGHLIYIKTGVKLSGLSPDILRYWRGNPRFPYDSTMDQQYDQPQFESYRQLGYLAGQAVGLALSDDGNPPAMTVAEQFEKARVAFAKLTATNGAVVAGAHQHEP